MPLFAPTFASPPMPDKAAAFANSIGLLDQTASWPVALRPKVAIDKSTANVIAGQLEAYVDVAGDSEVSATMGTRDSGDPNGYTAHGAKFGMHWLGVNGDQPGSSYTFAYQYFDGKFLIAVKDAYWVQTGPLQADNKIMLGPWDPGNGDNSRDGIVNLGRYTDAGVDGEGYTRHLRFNDVVFSGMLRGGGGSIKTTTPGLKPVLVAGSVTIPGWQVSDAGDTLNGDMYANAFYLESTSAPNIWGPASGRGGWFRSQLAAGDAQIDFLVDSKNTRNSGKPVFGVYMNSAATELFTVNSDSAHFAVATLDCQSFKVINNVGFYNTAPVVQGTVTGSRGGNAALASLLTKLAATGIIVDSTTA